MRTHSLDSEEFTCYASVTGWDAKRMPWFGADKLIARVREVHDACRAGRLVVFVGAGASTEGGLPDWDDLLKELVSQVTVGKDQKHLRAFLDHRCSDKIEQAQYLQEVLGNLTDSVLDRVAPRGGHHLPGSTLRAIARAFPSICQIFTTNYDELIEKAFEFENASKHDWQKRLVVISSDSPLHEKELGSREAPAFVVHKLHGPDQKIITLTEDEYSARLFSRRIIDSLWETVQATHTVLFLGTSLQDISFRFLSARVRRKLDVRVRPGYVVMRRPQLCRPEIKKVGKGRQRQEDYRQYCAAMIEKRWSHHGLRFIWLDDFAEAPEIVEEITSPHLIVDHAELKSTRLLKRMLGREGADIGFMRSALDEMLSELFPNVNGLKASLMVFDRGKRTLSIAGGSSTFPPPSHPIWSLCLGVEAKYECGGGCKHMAGRRHAQGVSCPWRRRSVDGDACARRGSPPRREDWTVGRLFLGVICARSLHPGTRPLFGGGDQNWMNHLPFHGIVEVSAVGDEHLAGCGEDPQCGEGPAQLPRRVDLDLADGLADGVCADALLLQRGDQ